MRSSLVMLICVIGLGACTDMAPRPDAAAATPAGGGSADLSCTLTTNCVDSVATGGLRPLPYTGTPEQAMALLRATLATFAEATIVRGEPQTLQVIFTTPAGFRDQVDFRIDPQAPRIDFRSRSLFGLFDFGKNRSRMEEFTRRFEQRARP